ncbi:hypothetical protein PLICRDRAFT_176325 [Plicaturopsis crispa FD-325 SS-3]|nr:hypothetical protein PLICRDRAFT_176325 [Plicaturopsis crispa FD-325 SS-3]
MAHGYVKHDPAIERWNIMREDVFRHFRFTSRTTWVTMCGVFIVPGAFYLIASSNDRKWNWRGALKGESLASKPASE